MSVLFICFLRVIYTICLSLCFLWWDFDFLSFVCRFKVNICEGYWVKHDFLLIIVIVQYSFLHIALSFTHRTWHVHVHCFFNGFCVDLFYRGSLWLGSVQTLMFFTLFFVLHLTFLLIIFIRCPLNLEICLDCQLLISVSTQQNTSCV